MTDILGQKINDFFDEMSEREYENLFSSERIKAFGTKEEYKKHLDFVKRIYPILQTTEVLLRNKIDQCFKKAISTGYSTFLTQEWLIDIVRYGKRGTDSIKKTYERIDNEWRKVERQFPRSNMLGQNANINDKKRLHNLLISRLSLGFWINIFRDQVEFRNTFFVSNFNGLMLSQEIFPNLYGEAPNIRNQLLDDRHYKSSQKRILKNKNYATIVFVSFLTSIRNRVSHCENILKKTQKMEEGKIIEHSSITSTFRNEIFSLKVGSIEKYLEGIFEDLRKDLSQGFERVSRIARL